MVRYSDKGLDFYFYGDAEASSGSGFGAQIFNQIVDEARRNGYPWVDPLFQASAFSLGDGLNLTYSNGAPMDIQWRRATDIAKDMFGSYPIFHGPYNQFGVNQGSVGNCWFLSVLADVALKPECIETLCPVDNDGIEFAVGVYHFRFWFKGKWVDVPVDDRLPCIMFDGKIQNTLFCKPTKDGGFWAPLVEKAYAKLFGKYSLIANGNGTESMQDFTGGFVAIHLAQEPNLLDTLKAAQSKDALIAWSTNVKVPDGRKRAYDPKNPGNESVSADGIVMDHEYSVLDIQDVTDRYSGNYVATLLKLRNPWGNDTEWIGDWSDSDPGGLWQTVNEAHLHCNTCLTDGQFWMSWKDVEVFTREFDICHWSGKDRGVRTLEGPDGGIDFIANGYFTAHNSSLPSNFQPNVFQGKSGYHLTLTPNNVYAAANEENPCELYINILNLNYNKSGTNEHVPSFGFYLLVRPGYYSPTDGEFFYNMANPWMQCRMVMKCRGVSYQGKFPANTSLFILPWITDPPANDSSEPYLIRVSTRDATQVHHSFGLGVLE